MLDDSSLKVSFAYDVEVVPTLCVVGADGQLQERLVGLARDEWRQALEGLAVAAEAGPLALDWESYPQWRPGCGSRSVDPAVADRLRAQAENSPLRARRIEVGDADDVFELMYDLGFSDGLPLVPPTPERVLRMLECTGRDAQEVVAVVPPNMGEATVEKVAINAVLAGLPAGISAGGHRRLAGGLHGRLQHPRRHGHHHGCQPGFWWLTARCATGWA